MCFLMSVRLYHRLMSVRPRWRRRHWTRYHRRRVVLLRRQVAVASFFAKNFLPLLTSTCEVIETLDNDIMESHEAAF